MSRTTTYITCQGTKVRETQNAVLFDIQQVSGQTLDEPRSKWIPWSQVSKSFTDPTTEGNDWICVAEWILKKDGLL